MDKWQEKYQNHWDKYSFKRERFVRDLLAAIEIKLEPYGYMAEGCDSGRERIAGEPDYKVIGSEKYIEVTGTHKPIGEDQEIWIRPDKVDYAFDHPEKTIYAVHVLDHIGLYRYLPIKICRQYPIETRLGDERYHITPAFIWATLKRGESRWIGQRS